MNQAQRRYFSRTANLALAVLLFAIGGGLAEAGCLVKVTKCAEAGEVGLSTATDAKTLRVPQAAQLVAIGEVLPERYMMLMNVSYYGLPPVSDGWRYYRVERDIYRVDAATRQVLERVTRQANRAFR